MRPISGALLTFAALMVLLPAVRWLLGQRVARRVEPPLA
jgi:hypothetical protein